jgi:hypothetical protein
MKNIQSEFLKLNGSDFGKGAVVAVFGAILPIIQSVIETGNFEFDWKAIGTVAMSAFIAYIAKNLFTSKEGKLFKKDKA